VQTCLQRFSESWESSWESYDAAAAEANAAAAKAEAAAKEEAEEAAAQARRALRSTCRVTMCASQLSLTASASQPLSLTRLMSPGAQASLTSHTTGTVSDTQGTPVRAARGIA